MDGATSDPKLRPSRVQWLHALGLFAVGIVVFLVAITLLHPAQPRTISGGTAAPAITLDDVAGHHHDVFTEARGQRVVVEFFATTCPTCQEQAGHVCSLANAHHDVRVYAVDSELEGAGAISDYARTRMSGCPVTFLVDPGNRTTHAWSVAVVPTVYLIRPDAKIAYGGIGADGIRGLDGALGG
ncbi:MAG: redoxin family protein [Candidatus Dormibacteria bacterium]